MICDSAMNDGLAEDFEDFFERSLNGYVTASPRGAILRVNARVAEWLGYSKQEMETMSVSDLLSVGGKIYFETHLRPLLRMQGMFDEIALELVSKQGTRLPILANALDRTDEQGTPLFVRFTFLRAVDRRTYEQSLRHDREIALEGRRSAEVVLSSERETAALREQFIAVLGHDLRNPLASIDAGLRMLARRELDDRSRSVVKLARTSTQRMQELIDDIMDFARGRLGGGIPLERHSVTLEPVLLQAVEELRIANPECRIETDITLPTPVLCDAHRLSQLVSNLLANAISHGAQDQPVWLRAAQDEDGLDLSIANQGEPIPEALLDNLFQPFTRAENSTSRQGLGLGLYIASEIAKSHGGTLSATSDDNETRFTLRIPAPDAAP